MYIAKHIGQRYDVGRGDELPTFFASLRRKEVAAITVKNETMEFNIREIGRPELEKKAEVVRRSFGTVAEQLGLSTEDQQARQAILDGKKTGDETENGDMTFGAFLAVDGKETMVGSAQIVKKCGGVYDLTKLAVLPGYRHNGCGRALIEYCCAYARKEGCCKLTITIIEANTVLKNWYLKLGFKHVGTTKYTHLPYTIGFMEYDL